MQVVVKTAPGQLPFAVSTALRHIRALEDDADLVELYCRAAVQTVEDYTGRALLRTVYTAQLDAWPDFGCQRGILPGPASRNLDTIVLPRSPLVAIGSVKYYPEDGGAQATWDATNYRADIRSLPGRLVLAESYEFPAIAVRADAVEVEFTAGEGTAEGEVPAPLLMCALTLARHFFDNPGCVDADGKVRKMPYSFDMLRRQFRV